MAEGPDPEQTLAKSEFILPLRLKYAIKSVSGVPTPSIMSAVYTISCYLVISPLIAPAAPNLKELSNALDSVVDWHSLGVKLGVEDHKLSAIDKTFRGDIARCKHEMLICCSRSDKLLTWKTVADALHLMGEHEVAFKIQAKYCSSSTENADIVDTADTAGTYVAICVFGVENYTMST